MIVYLLSKFITICFGMLYPAYSSYKAIKTKDAKEYVQWMMYWIVFSVYSIFEIFADAFFGCWFPFYYEIKILFMFWMLSPTTRGGSTLYRRFIHPALTKHEQEIDGYLADAKRTTGNMVTRWGSRALSYVTDSFVRIVLRRKAILPNNPLAIHNPSFPTTPALDPQLYPALLDDVTVRREQDYYESDEENYPPIHFDHPPYFRSGRIESESDEEHCPEMHFDHPPYFSKERMESESGEEHYPEMHFDHPPYFSKERMESESDEEHYPPMHFDHPPYFKTEPMEHEPNDELMEDINNGVNAPQAPHLAQEYVQRSPSRRPIHQPGYPMYEEEYHYANNDYTDAPYQMETSDSFSASPNLVHAGRSGRHPNANEMSMNENENFLNTGPSAVDNREVSPGAVMPPPGMRQKAQMAKKMKNEFGNFSVVTAQDGSMNNKPIIFGWYPYSETPTGFTPDISSGVIPSVFPSVLPSVPFLGSQEVPIRSDSSPSSSSKAVDSTLETKPVDPVETSPTDEFADPLTSEEHSVDDFFDCEEVEKKEEGKGKESAGSKATGTESAVSKAPAVSPSIKVVGKTNLQAFDEKSASAKMATKKSVDNLARHSSSESLAAVKRKTASLTSLSKLDKTKARKSFSGTESKPKVALFSSQSFRRVLHPFVSSKSLTSSHSSKNVSRSSTSVDASKESATKPDKS